MPSAAASVQAASSADAIAQEECVRKGIASAMRLGIRTQLIGHTLLTALLVGGSTIGYSIYIHRSSVRQALHTRAETMAAALADALVEPIERKDFQLISLQMEIAEHDPDV